MFGLVLAQDVQFSVKSSGCKPDALLKLHLVCPSTLSSMLTLLRLISSCVLCLDILVYVYYYYLRRVTGGVCVLHGPIQLSSLFLVYY